MGHHYLVGSVINDLVGVARYYVHCTTLLVPPVLNGNYSGLNEWSLKVVYNKFVL